MLTTLLVILGVSISLIASYLAYSVSRLDYFRKPLQVVARYRGEPVGKDKRSMRKLRKIKADLDRAKKRFMLLFLVHLAIFITAYTILVSLVFIITPREEMLLEIPIGIPLISYQEDSAFVTNAVFIAFIGFMAPSYLFARIVKTVQALR